MSLSDLVPIAFSTSEPIRRRPLGNPAPRSVWDARYREKNLETCRERVRIAKQRAKERRASC